jgi:hypothetical protein
MNWTSLDDVSCLMMSDTGLYLNWNPNTLTPDDEDSFEPWLEGDAILGKWDLFRAYLPDE